MAFAISDIGNEHLLRKDGNWYAKPIQEEDLDELVMFDSGKDAENFCVGKHVRPYSLEGLSLEDRALIIAEAANECCGRSDGYEDDIKALALKHLEAAFQAGLSAK